MATTTLFNATSHPLSPPIRPLSSSRRVQFALSSPPSHVKLARCRVGPIGQWRLTGRLPLSCRAVKTIGQSEFGAEVLESELPVLVDFVAEWCGPCRLIAPAVDWASQTVHLKAALVYEKLLKLPLPSSTDTNRDNKNLLRYQEFEGRIKVVKIDHDANPQLIEKYKVYGLPTLILFKNGEEVPDSRREGAVTKAKLKEYLESLLESTSVAESV